MIFQDEVSVSSLSDWDCVHTATDEFSTGWKFVRLGAPVIHKRL